MEFDEIENKHKVLIDKAVEMMKQITNDPKHSINHTLRVVKFAKEILKEVDADREVVIISAYWHDVGRLECGKGHALISANKLKEEMQKLNYNEEMIEKCYKAIVNHSWYDEPKTVEGYVVRDADKIDFIAYERWKECIEHNNTLNSIVEILPRTREELLKFEISKKIFDLEIAKLVGFLHNKIFDI